MADLTVDENGDVILWTCDRCGDVSEDVEDVDLVEIGGEPDERRHRTVALCAACRGRRANG
jgi:hypothetical protein